MLTIHREKQPDRLIRMGHAPVVLDAPLCPDAELPDIRIEIELPDAPPEPVKNQRGRPKKMAEERKLGEETGVKKIHQEDAGKQGPVGTGADKPANPPSEDLTIGNKEGEKNG